LSENPRNYILKNLTERESHEIGSRWKIFAHAHQTPPALAPDGKPWHTWLMIGGRGAGKTRAGAEWVRAQALGLPPFATEKAARIALVGETEHDVREVMIEGVSGLLAVHGWHERPVWLPSRKRLEWKDGQVAQVFSAEDPQSLRGPQFSCAWSDEMAKWRYADDAFDMLQFGLRLGSQPRQLITTTPRPREFLKRLRRVGRRDVRLRRQRPVGRQIAGPPRRAGVGDRRAGVAGAGRAEDTGAVRARVPGAMQRSSALLRRTGTVPNTVLGTAPALRRTASRSATRCTASGARLFFLVPGAMQRAALHGVMLRRTGTVPNTALGTAPALRCTASRSATRCTASGAR
jgi:phage terminase large subunit-like protein